MADMIERLAARSVVNCSSPASLYAPMSKLQPKPYFSLPTALLAAFVATAAPAAHSAIPPELENRLFSEDCNNGDAQTVSFIVKGQTKQYWKRGALTTKVEITDMRPIGGRQFRMTGRIAATKEELSEEFELLDQGYRTLARTLGGEEVIRNGRTVADNRSTRVILSCSAKTTAWRANAPKEVREADAALDKRIDDKFKELGLLDDDPPARKPLSAEAEDAVTVKMCNAVKRMGRQTLERVSSDLGVNPRDISLERTEISTGLSVNFLQGPSSVRQSKICVAVLYTPRGTVQYLVEEVTGGAVTSGRQR